MDEFCEAITTIAPDAPSRNFLELAFEEADEDESGGCDRDEFLQLFAKVKKGGVVGIGFGDFFSQQKEEAAPELGLAHGVLTKEDLEVASEAFDKVRTCVCVHARARPSSFLQFNPDPIPTPTPAPRIPTPINPPLPRPNPTPPPV